MSEPPFQTRISRRHVLIGGTLGLAAMLSGISSCDTPGTITVNFLYSTEKSEWLEPAIQAFNNSNRQYNGKVIQVISTNSGSLDFAEKIVKNQLQPRPDAWCPASELELNRLDHLWQKANGLPVISSSTDLAPRSLVRSPFVFAVWKDRAAALLNAYTCVDWDTIHTALSLQDGWSNRALKHPEWGTQIHLGQTRPDLSNSGLLSTTLMACAYFGSLNLSLTQAQVKDPTLWKYLAVFENAVNHFGESSGTYFSEAVIGEGPAAHTITLTYESLVLLQDHVPEPLEMFYPKVNVISTHPFAILNGPWLTSERQQAAKMLRDFLRSDEQQREAIKHGFRPWDSTKPLADKNDPKNPFNKFSQLSPAHALDTPIEPVITTPSGDVVDALITQWQNHYPWPS